MSTSLHPVNSGDMHNYDRWRGKYRCSCDVKGGWVSFCFWSFEPIVLSDENKRKKLSSFQKKTWVVRRTKVRGGKQHDSRCNCWEQMKETLVQKIWKSCGWTGQKIFLARRGWIRMWWILSICGADHVSNGRHKAIPNGGTKHTRTSGHM